MIRLCAFSDEAANSISDQIDALRRNGIRMTELRSVDGITVSNIGEDGAREIKKALDAGGISVWALGSQYGKVSLGEGFDRGALFEELRRLCRMANVLATDKIRMFSFYDSADKADQVFELLSESVKIAAGYGVELYHENELDIYGEFPERVLELHENVPGLRFVLDGATYVHKGRDANEALRLLFPISSYFHIKDAIAETREHVPAGEGDAAIEALIDAVGDDSDVTFTVEPHLVNFAAFAAIDRTVLKMKYKLRSNNESFDLAVASLKALLDKHNKKYSEEE